MEVLGIPDKEFVNRSSRKKLFFGQFSYLCFTLCTHHVQEPNGIPRVAVNSKGRRRRPGSKTIYDALRHRDKSPPEEEFVDFISKCLVWDPERRLKPQAAMRHPFMTAGKLRSVSSAKPATSTSGLNASKSKQLLETPKKSMISAPTPLTARTSKTATNNGVVPSTPSTSTHASTLGSSSRSYRTSQGASLSYQSSRTLNGFAVSILLL